MKRSLIFNLFLIYCFNIGLEAIPLQQQQLDKNRLHSRQTRSIDKAPINGLDVVGCGYDVTSMSSRFCLLDLNGESDFGNWIDPQNTSAEFFVPQGFYVRDAPEATHILETRIIHTLQEYFEQSIYTTTKKSGGFLGFGAKRSTTEIGSMYKRIYEQNYTMTLTARQIIWYVLSVVTFPAPKFNSITTSTLANLPTIFDATDTTNVLKFEKFFNAFGTHIVTSSAMGGLIWAQDWLETCLLQYRNTSWIRKQVTRRYDPFGFFTKSTSSDDTTILVDTFFETHSAYSVQLLGGTESVPVSDWLNWLTTVKYNPRPVSYDLEPIYTLLPIGSAQRDALEAATFHYREQANLEASIYIQQLQSMPKPPDSQCVPPTNRRRRRSIFDLTPENRALLCPYVGTEGLTCPGDPNTSTRSSTSVNSYYLREDSNGLIRLPRGVGTAFDISTGRLTFPAFSWTFEDGTRWQEHLSSRIFLIPSETILEPTYIKTNVQHRDEEIYHVFDKALMEQNIINGGFFARQSNPMEYYEKYDAIRQVPIIIQNPTLSLYYLTAINPTLNSLASNAIAQLTTTYDEELYNEFLDVWGTHIAMNTTIGGMVELQTSDNRCSPVTTTRRPPILCSNEQYTRLFACNCQLPRSSDGKVINAEDRLIFCNHLLAAKRARRRVRQDTSNTKHRLGGDVTIDNDDQWEPTIGQNPALLMINRFSPWSDFVSDPTIKTNLNTAINARIASARSAQATNWQAVEEKRAGIPRCPPGEEEIG